MDAHHDYLSSCQKYYLGPLSGLPGFGSLEARSIRGWRLLSVIVSASSQSATSYWVIFQMKSFPNASDNLATLICKYFMQYLFKLQFKKTLSISNLGTRHKPQPTSCSLLNDSCFNLDGSIISNLMSGRGLEDFQFSY